MPNPPPDQTFESGHHLVHYCGPLNFDYIVRVEWYALAPRRRWWQWWRPHASTGTYFGNCSVWHYLTSGRRCGTSLEYALCKNVWGILKREGIA